MADPKGPVSGQTVPDAPHAVAISEVDIARVQAASQMRGPMREWRPNDSSFTAPFNPNRGGLRVAMGPLDLSRDGNTVNVNVGGARLDLKIESSASGPADTYGPRQPGGAPSSRVGMSGVGVAVPGMRNVDFVTDGHSAGLKLTF